MCRVVLIHRMLFLPQITKNMAEGLVHSERAVSFYGDPAKYSWPPRAHGLDCNLDSLFEIGVLKHIEVISKLSFRADYGHRCVRLSS